LLYLTYSGKLVFVSTADIPLQERAGKGTPLRDLSRDPAVAAEIVAKDLNILVSSEKWEG